MEHPTRLPLFVGVGLMVAGWAAIVVAWFQAGRQELEVGQIPYLISGGFGGFALILMGVAGVLLYMFTHVMWMANRHADELVEALGKVESAARARSNAGGGSGAGGRRRGSRGKGGGRGGARGPRRSQGGSSPESPAGSSDSS